ncbi:MAG: TRAP transporter small permease subunit [Thiolinea sp.]
MNSPTSESENQTDPVHTVLRGIVWTGHAAAWLILPILMLVLLGVVLSAAKVGTFASWESDVFLFGSKLSLASIGDMQWHLFGIMLMLSLAGALVSDKHVRVDILRQHMSERGKAWVDLIGHLIFLLPFAIIVVWHGLDFTSRSFSMGEGSDYDGLYDRFLLKSFIPIGFSLLTAAGLGLAIIHLRKIFKKRQVDHD